MSLLPQRKKSAGEIAKLRESLGIAGPPPAAEELPAEPSAVTPEPEPELAKPPEVIVEAPPAAPLAPLPEIHEPKPVRSLKRSERIPVLPVDGIAPTPKPAPTEQRTIPAPMPLPVDHGARTVKSLRKSEQGPLPTISPPAPDSSLPIHRRTDQELNEIRRRDALAMLAPPVRPPALAAHKALIIPGYLAAIAGGVCFLIYDLEMTVTAACVAAALLVAGFIQVKKPLSRHHAAFIGAISLFVIVFGALHYFPQLRHGT